MPRKAIASDPDALPRHPRQVRRIVTASAKRALEALAAGGFPSTFHALVLVSFASYAARRMTARECEAEVFDLEARRRKTIGLDRGEWAPGAPPSDERAQPIDEEVEEVAHG